MTTNPVAGLGAALLIALCLVLTIDWVSAATALGLELVVALAVRLPVRTLWRATLPVVIAAPLTAITIALYGQSSGTIYAEFLFARVSEGSLELAVATLLRVLAIGLPAVVLFVMIDPTELSDGLAQRVHLPERFVLGALASFRLVGLFVDDWAFLALARRARGVADRGRLRRLGGQGFALLVLAIRRGSALATAMRAASAPARRGCGRASLRGAGASGPCSRQGLPSDC